MAQMPPHKKARTLEEQAQPKNTSIYITGLPDTIGQIQLSDIVKKYGRVKKIKIYKDEYDRPKGDALVTFKYNDNKVTISNARVRCNYSFRVC